MKKNNQLDKMAEQFQSVEELQAYSAAQYNTILSLNTKINELTKQLEELSKKNAQLNKDLAVASLSQQKDQSQFAVSDEEAACTIQIAMIKRNAMDRELTTDETKRLEIFVKTLCLIKGKGEAANKNQEEKTAASTDSSDLVKQLENLTKQNSQ